MCFSRRSSWRAEQREQIHEDPVWRLFDREHEADRPQPIADHERVQRDAEESRDQIPVGAKG